MFIKSKHLDHPIGGGGGDFFENFESKILFYWESKGVGLFFIKKGYK